MTTLEAFIHDICDRHYDDDDATFYGRLDNRARAAVAVRRLVGQVYNGGWVQWVDNNYARTDNVRETLGALARMATPSALAAADLVRTVLWYAPAYYNAGPWGEVNLSPLDACNQPMWDISDQLLADLADYCEVGR